MLPPLHISLLRRAIIAFGAELNICDSSRPRQRRGSWGARAHMALPLCEPDASDAASASTWLSVQTHTAVSDEELRNDRTIHVRHGHGGRTYDTSAERSAKFIESDPAYYVSRLQSVSKIHIGLSTPKSSPRCAKILTLDDRPGYGCTVPVAHRGPSH